MIKNFVAFDPATKIAYYSLATLALVFGTLLMMTQTHP